MSELTTKKYPSALRMRPILLQIGVFAVIALVLCLMFVLITSMKAQRNKTTTAELNVAKDLATRSDVEWYQNARSGHAQLQSKPPEKSSVKTLLPNAAVSPVIQQQTPIKAFSPAITSNQLQGEQFYKNANASPIATNAPANTDRNASSASMTIDDPGQQIQKTAFLNSLNSLNSMGKTVQDDYLTTTVNKPLSYYEVKAGTIIPAVLMTGINSDLPGQITAQVKSPVYDTVSGRYLLIPQGARLIGIYDSHIVYGQARVLVAWKRIIFPNGNSMNLDGMPGVDIAGYAGFKDKVNNHYSKIFASVILMSTLSAGAQLSQPQQSNTNNQAPTVNQIIAQSLGTSIANAGVAMLNKNMNIPPTLQIRPGYPVNIAVTKDMVFPGAY